VLVITAQRHRTQERNRVDALARLLDLVRPGGRAAPAAAACHRPTAGSKRRRLDAKTRRGAVKALRGVGEVDE
jgi:ribosome-associated protein